MLARARRPLLALLGAVGTAGIVLAYISGALPAPGAALRRHPPTPPSAAIRPHPVRGALSAATVLSLQMFSPAIGVGVVRVRGAHAYLAETSDGAATWQPLGALPHSLALPAVPPPRIVFVHPAEGYVLDPENGEIFFTADAGTRWAPLSVPGRATQIARGGRWLWVTTSVCAADTQIPAFCASDLVRLDFGSTKASAVTTVPTIGPVRRAHHHAPWAATVLARPSATAAVYLEGGEGGPTSLLETPNGGRSWHLLADPCKHLVPTALATPPGGPWTLYCSLDGGMNQGTNKIFTSRRDGTGWRLVAAADARGRLHVGRVTDEMAFRIVASGDGSLLWLFSTVGPVSVSGDGGRRWHQMRTVEGGFDSSFSTAGSVDAWIAQPGKGIFRTLDGRHWQLLR